MFKYRDFYFNKAKKENFFARSIFKLEELDIKFKLVKKNYHVLDLGYYPGSWIQYLIKKVDGQIIGVDKAAVNKKLSSHNLTLFSRDVFTLNSPSDLGLDFKFDLILSDMAPSTSGIKMVDQSASLELVAKIYQLLPAFLKDDGKLVYKVFASKDHDDFLNDNKKIFKSIDFFRAKATRKNSKEVFVIANGFKA